MSMSSRLPRVQFELANWSSLAASFEWNRKREKIDNAPAAVAVLLSTYNGEHFVDSQVQSILNQSWPNLRLIIRDDGSTDSTWDRLQKWRSDPRVLLVRGSNKGAGSSFLQMLGMLDGKSEFAAFADQDDVWHPEKIARAMAELSFRGSEGRPTLYCARSFLADEQLAIIGTTPLWPRAPSFGNALVENIATGCTIVLNPDAVTLLKSAAAPVFTVMHDWWCYLVVSAFGDVIFDPRPSVLLRQHGGNLVGVTSGAQRWLGKVTRQLRQDSLALLIDQATSFRMHFGRRQSLQHDARELLDRLLLGSFWERRALVMDGRLHRQFPVDDALMRARLLSGPWPETRQDNPEPTALSPAHVGFEAN